MLNLSSLSNSVFRSLRNEKANHKNRKEKEIENREKQIKNALNVTKTKR